MLNVTVPHIDHFPLRTWAIDLGSIARTGRLAPRPATKIERIMTLAKSHPGKMSLKGISVKRFWKWDGESQ